jgi:hypothetical protein
MEELTIGFLSSAKFENDSVIRGAILVTDVETKPLEFRVTAPVRPTNFQKTLYGDILTEHVLVELVTIPLFKALSQKPHIVVVRDPLFIGGNERQDVPIVRVLRTAKYVLLGAIRPNNLRQSAVSTSRFLLKLPNHSNQSCLNCGSNSLSFSPRGACWSRSTESTLHYNKFTRRRWESKFVLGTIRHRLAQSISKVEIPSTRSINKWLKIPLTILTLFVAETKTRFSGLKRGNTDTRHSGCAVSQRPRRALAD